MRIKPTVISVLLPPFLPGVVMVVAHDDEGHSATLGLFDMTTNADLEYIGARCVVLVTKELRRCVENESLELGKDPLF